MIDTYDPVAAKKAELIEAGFVFDPTGHGRERWTHRELGLTVVKQPYMNALQWAAAMHGAANRAHACRSHASTSVKVIR